ncbi:facilitated trehalose transporter Tret1-like [Sitodiplosis mosellana]|uniref:facilitated trehalose transporter Tret1-like n=1 Tax=Sitodiplosis mosellana TaxID=263140 RepID=UPI002444788E|nr:facilitated trehalose transporter Tret1-like [Sitodiplosis mosellana]
MEKNTNFQWKNPRNQYYAVIAANLILLSQGCLMGWISPAIPKLTSESTPLTSGLLTTQQVSWIGSISCIGVLVGSLSFGYFTSFMGCKRAMLFLTVPSIGAWLLIYFGQTFDHILLSRALSGWSTGGITTTIILFVSEIANNDIRGRLGGISHFMRNIGILIGYTLGATLEYHIIPCICIFMPIIYAISFAALPNTPRYYLQRGQTKKAEDALKYYKGYRGESVEENIALYDELERLNRIVNERKSDEKLQASDIFNRAVMKGLGIGISLAILAQLTANFPLVTYAVTILKKSGTSFNPYASSIVLAVMLILGSSVNTYLADIFGRKRLNFISLTGSAVGQLATSLYHYLYISGYDLSLFSWVPVVSLSFVIFILAAGILPLQLICVVEYLPPKVWHI